MTFSNPRSLKRMILLFWGIYFALVLASNTTDALRQAGLLQEDFVFASGNYSLIENVTGRFGIPSAVNIVLFAGVLLWQLLATVLFFRACAIVQFGPDANWRAVYQAFVTALGLWAAFILVDELFIAYEVASLEATHVRLAASQLLTLLALHWLPDEP